ncbi:caspase family protein [Blastopirellula marina]|nr:caspase family protein [Blastopirellula marina]
MPDLVRKFIFLLLLSFPAPLCAQVDLPSESILPGRQALPTFSHDSLPAEAEIPGLPVVTPPKEDPAAPQVSPSDLIPLPGEDQLPQFEVVQQVALPEDPPWLRLSLSGPTAPLQTVCFSRDGSHLLAGGNDKLVHSWIAAPRQAGQPQRWIYETPVRWQVQRATRGDIHTIAPLRGKFAFAGIGASALTGEIVLADEGRMAFERTLFDVEKGARSQILDLAASPTRLFSLDSEGSLQAWSADPQTGKWNFVSVPTSAEALSDKTGQLRPWRLRGSRLAASDHGFLYFPVAVRSEQGIPYWRVGKWNGSGSAALVPQINQEFPGGIGAMACDASGQRIAAADISDASKLVLTDLKNAASSLSIATDANVRDVTMSADGTKVAAILAKSPQGPFELRIWNWNKNAKPGLLSTVPLPSVAAACAFRPDGKFVAVTQEQAIEVYELAQLDKAVRLTTPLITPGKVAFTLDVDYKLVIQPSGDSSEAIVFDTSKRQYSIPKPTPATVPANPWAGKWSLRQQVLDRGTKFVFQVMQNDQIYCQIPTAILGTARVTSVCWLAHGERRDVPSWIVIGTTGRNHAYLLDISDPQNVRVLREFRGHSSAVRSVGVSVDERYLVTASDDGLVNLWKLTEKAPSSPLQNAWGAEFEIVQNHLVVRNIIPDGPLYYRGVRSGDVIASVAIRPDANSDLADQNEKTIADAQGILDTLKATSGQTMLRFQITRNGAAQRPFYLHPAWQPLASLAMTAQREWAFWTPYGYYDASFNGHRIFGWQINKGIDQAPDFFLAAELRKQLEKPRVMERLLPSGSLSAAMQVAKATVPFDLHHRLEALASLRPQIEITTPTTDQALTGSAALLEAIVKVPPGAELVPPKAFANGVPAVELVAQETSATDDGVRHTFRWQMALPPEERVRFDVVAGTTDGILATQSITAVQDLPAKIAPPRIFVIAAGISHYDDQQIPQLDFAAANAQALVDTMEQHARQANVETIVLTDASVTQPLWNVAADSMWQRLRETARPQDVVLLFLSGHGVRDVETKRYFFLTSDSRFADVAGRRYERCISSDAFQQYFAGLPCRKVAILDTCHSGAIQPLRQDDLKVMLRSLEEDVILTITASEGDEEAFESRDRQLGRFTARLVEGLSGQADQPEYGGNGDGQVSLNEAAQYVEATVPQDAAAAGQSQHPSIFPRDLFPLINVPLSTSEAP